MTELVLSLLVAICILPDNVLGHPGGHVALNKVTLKCTTPKCDWQANVTQQQAADMFFPPKPGVPEEERFIIADPDMREVAKCPKCKKKSVFRADWCKKCKTWFIPSVNIRPMDPKATTKCPDCGFDPAVERLREWKKKHGK